MNMPTVDTHHLMNKMMCAYYDQKYYNQMHYDQMYYNQMHYDRCETCNPLVSESFRSDHFLPGGFGGMKMVQETQTPSCIRCQKMSCECLRNDAISLPPHHILPYEMPMQNFISTVYPIEQKFLIQNPIYSMDHTRNNMYPYQHLPMVPSNFLSPPSSSSPPPSPKTSPTLGTRKALIKKFKCDVCDRAFDYKHVLQNHQRIHTGEKPYKCATCGNRFKRDHHLKTHMRLHTGERPFGCQHCGMRFVQVANLRRHLKIHDPIKCDTCLREFPDVNLLQRHLLEHNLDSNVVCDICRVNHENECPLRLNRLRISLANDIGNDGDYESGESEENAQYEKPESIHEVLDLSTTVENATQSEPEDLSMKKYYC